jgi:hypothetical protein
MRRSAPEEFTMLLAIAFLMFAALIAAWMITPDSGKVEEVAAKAMPETSSAPARA